MILCKDNVMISVILCLFICLVFKVKLEEMSSIKHVARKPIVSAQCLREIYNCTPLPCLLVIRESTKSHLGGLH